MPGFRGPPGRREKVRVKQSIERLGRRDAADPRPVRPGPAAPGLGRSRRRRRRSRARRLVRERASPSERTRSRARRNGEQALRAVSPLRGLRRAARSARAGGVAAARVPGYARSRRATGRDRAWTTASSCSTARRVCAMVAESTGEPGVATISERTLDVRVDVGLLRLVEMPERLAELARALSSRTQRVGARRPRHRRAHPARGTGPRSVPCPRRRSPRGAPDARAHRAACSRAAAADDRRPPLGGAPPNERTCSATRPISSSDAYSRA